MTKPLDLTMKDHRNYLALCNFVAGRVVRPGGSRRTPKDSLTKPQRFSKLTYQDFCCAHCGEPFEFKNGKYLDVTQDHIIKYCYGGEANLHNIELVHGDCNQERDHAYDLIFIEKHYGKIDMNMIENIPTVSFNEDTYV